MYFKTFISITLAVFTASFGSSPTTQAYKINLQSHNHTTTSLDIPDHRKLAGNNGWAGANSYFLQNFQDHDRDQVLDAMKAANLKILRIFISATGPNRKNTNSLNVPDVEVDTPGNFQSYPLERVDALMYAAYKRGIKLIITMHDRWLLGYWGRDVYAKKYNLAKQEISDFYYNPRVAQEFDQRFYFILTHKNPYFGGRTWGNIPEAVFAIGIQNESQQGCERPNFRWICDRARHIRRLVSPPILITTGGTALELGVPGDLGNCAALDVLSFHFYGMPRAEITQRLIDARSQTSKRFFVEEFGALDRITSDPAVKARRMQGQVDAVKAAGVPWMFWQVTKPGAGPRDYEIWTDEPAWQNVKNAAYQSFTTYHQWPEMNF